MTFNKHNTYEWFRTRVYRLEDTPHDPSDFHGAMDAALTWGEKIPIGLIYRDANPRPSLHRRIPDFRPAHVHQPVAVGREQRRKLVAEFI